PYLDPAPGSGMYADWLSVLAYNSYMINPINNRGDKYVGLFQQGTKGDAYYQTHERGYVDEYNFSFGGNVSDVVNWGISVGVTDLSYERNVLYSESMSNAYIATESKVMTTGNAGFDLYNTQNVSGNGWNLNLGLIFRPVNELRIGLAVKTPTWWNLQHSVYSEVDYSYYNPGAPESKGNPLKGKEYTGDDDYPGDSYASRLKSPWHFNIGVAGVIGRQAIVSLDYERIAYPDMSIKHQSGYYGNSFVEATEFNQDIKDYFQAANALRLGVEYRVTPQFSVRAGYAWESSAVKSEAADGNMQIYTVGCDPSYTFNKTVNQLSLGCGYRYQSWYIDAAYVYRKCDGEYHAFTNWDGYRAPSGHSDISNSSLVLSTGFKF
ncbi:MAG: outer membrane protein transport protein, partial [Muribaculaceae bacterium]|nr:outer membrane protein transport protein [Muribaculaceae bacterium]